MFKRLCILCGNKSENRYPLCSKCIPEVLIRDNCCTVCGIPTSSFVSKCPRCREKEYCFVSNYSFFHYSSKPKVILYQYKFRKEYSFKFYYSQLLSDYIIRNFNDPVICPVPTSYIKKVIKGWYQLNPILNELVKNGLVIKSLLRKRYSKTQKKLNRSEREDNLKDKFTVKKHKLLKARNILLFDDVFTTGATVNSCACVLNRFGYKNIYVITLCRD